MTEGDPTDRLSAKRQFVLVLRLVVEVDGKVTGEIVDPLLERRQRFMDSLASSTPCAYRVGDALGSIVRQQIAVSGTGSPETPLHTVSVIRNKRTGSILCAYGHHPQSVTARH